MQSTHAPNPPTTIPPDREYPALYEISVIGKVPEPLSERLTNLKIRQIPARNGSEITSFSGRFLNQEDLLQVTTSLHAMNLTLTSVEWLESFY